MAKRSGVWTAEDVQTLWSNKTVQIPKANTMGRSQQLKSEEHILYFWYGRWKSCMSTEATSCEVRWQWLRVWGQESAPTEERTAWRVMLLMDDYVQSARVFQDFLQIYLPWRLAFIDNDGRKWRKYKYMSTTTTPPPMGSAQAPWIPTTKDHN